MASAHSAPTLLPCRFSVMARLPYNLTALMMRVRRVRFYLAPTPRIAAPAMAAQTTDAHHVDELLTRLAQEHLFTIIVDHQRIGFAHCSPQSGHSAVMLENPELWQQGLGNRAVSLLLHHAFQINQFAKLVVNNLPDQAEAGRLAWEEAGFSQVRRHLVDDQVHLDLELSRACHLANEDRIFLVRHAETTADTEQMAWGSVDNHLSAIGRAQTESLRNCALLFQVEECICSPHQQARATAERIFARRVMCPMPCVMTGKAKISAAGTISRSAVFHAPMLGCLPIPWRRKWSSIPHPHQECPQRTAHRRKHCPGNQR